MMSERKVNFEVGDKVKCVTDKYANGQKHSDGKVGEIYTVIGMFDGEVHTQECDYIFEGHMLLNLEEIVTTPKDLLKNFIRAVTRDGSVYITIGNMLVDQNNMYILQDNLDNNLENKFKELSVDSLYWCEEDNLLIDFSYQGTLIWQRESKEELEKKAQRESLEASVKVMQAELEMMKKQLKDMK